MHRFPTPLNPHRNMNRNVGNRCWAAFAFRALLRKYMAHTLPAPPSTSPTVPRWPVVRNPLGAYAAAVALTSLALFLRLQLDPMLGNAARLSFFMFAATMSAFLF